MPKTLSSSLDRFRYRELAQWFVGRLRAGHWGVNERLPSVRELMRERNASMATVVKALEALEAEGLIVSRPRSGWFVRRLPADRSSPPVPANTQTQAQPLPVAVSRQVLELLAAANAKDMLSLGSAVVDASLLPVRDVHQALRAVAMMAPHKTLATIHSPLGERALRIQIARLMAQRGCELSPEDIVITAGDGVAIETALQLVTQPGATVAVESPTYFGILQALENLGLQAIEVATDAQYGIDLAALESVLHHNAVSAIVLNPTFHNPFGCSMPHAAKAALLALAEQYDLPIVEDDVYGDLYFDAQRPQALKSFDRSARVIHCSSFSKTLAPGWRIGWCVPGRWHEAFVERQFLRTNGISALPQRVLAHYLAGRSYGRHLGIMRNAFAAQMPRVRDLVHKHFPAGTKVTEPQGGYLFWVELPDACNAMQVVEAARRHAISIAPGSIFSATQQFDHCIRLSVGTLLTPQIEEAIGRLGTIVEQVWARGRTRVR